MYIEPCGEFNANPVIIPGAEDTSAKACAADSLTTCSILPHGKQISTLNTGLETACQILFGAAYRDPAALLGEWGKRHAMWSLGVSNVRP